MFLSKAIKSQRLLVIDFTFIEIPIEVLSLARAWDNMMKTSKFFLGFLFYKGSRTQSLSTKCVDRLSPSAPSPKIARRVEK